MAAARSLRLLAAVLIVVIAGPGLAEGAVHGEVPNLIETCGSRLNWIYSTRYPAPRSPGELNCSSVITKALESRDTQSCPAEADLVKCFNVSYPPSILCYENAQAYIHGYLSRRFLSIIRGEDGSLLGVGSRTRCNAWSIGTDFHVACPFNNLKIVIENNCL